MTAQNSYESDDQETVKPCRKKIEFDHHHRQQPAETKSRKKESRSQPRNDVLCQSSAVVVSPLIKENTRTPTNEAEASTEDTGRERLKRHRVEVAGRVWIPDIWGQEALLKDWIDCGAFDATIMNGSIMSARAALVEDGRRPHSTRITIENSC